MPVISLSEFLQQVLAIAKNDTLKTALPVIGAFLANISNNTSEINLVAQIGALQVNLAAALPDDQQAIIKDITAILEQEIAAIQASPTNAAGGAPVAANKA